MEVRNYDHAIEHQEVQVVAHESDAASRGWQSPIKIHSGLPQELRDHIHTFCVQGPQDNEVIVRRSTGNNIAFYVRQPIGGYSYQWIEDPIFSQLITDRIGLGNARELLAAYYRTRTFKFAHRELGLIQTFLDADNLSSLRMRPVDHIRCLHLQIEPFLYGSLGDDSSLYNGISSCSAALEALAAIQALRTAVIIHIDLARELPDDEEHEKLLIDAAGVVLQIIRIVNALIGKGVKIEMIFEGRWDESNGLKVCSSSGSSIGDCIAQMRIARNL